MDCSVCGCNVMQLVEIGMLQSRPWAVLACDHCGTQVRLTGQFAQVRPSGLPRRDEYTGKAICPECGSTETAVYSHGQGGKSSRTRYHKCGCGATFKTPKRG